MTCTSQANSSKQYKGNISTLSPPWYCNRNKFWGTGRQHQKRHVDARDVESAHGTQIGSTPGRVKRQHWTHLFMVNHVRDNDIASTMNEKNVFKVRMRLQSSKTWRAVCDTMLWLPKSTGHFRVSQLIWSQNIRALVAMWFSHKEQPGTQTSSTLQGTSAGKHTSLCPKWWLAWRLTWISLAHPNS